MSGRGDFPVTSGTTQTRTWASELAIPKPLAATKQKYEDGALSETAGHARSHTARLGSLSFLAEWPNWRGIRGRQRRFLSTECEFV